MTDAAATARVRRMLVALDASAPSLAALSAAVQMAARLGAEVAGLFVEDEDLVRLGGHGAARIIDSSSSASRAPDAAEMGNALRAMARAARGALEQSAARARLTWSFRVARGRVAPEVVAAAAHADVVCLGRAGWFGARGARLGSTAAAVASSSPSHVLLVRDFGDLADAPVVLHDGSGAGSRALDLALELCARDGGRLVVCVPRELAAHLEPEIERRAAERGVTATIRALGEPPAARGGLLVLPASVADDALPQVAAAGDAALLLVR